MHGTAAEVSTSCEHMRSIVVMHNAHFKKNVEDFTKPPMRAPIPTAAAYAHRPRAPHPNGVRARAARHSRAVAIPERSPFPGGRHSRAVAKPGGTPFPDGTPHPGGRQTRTARHSRVVAKPGGTPFPDGTPHPSGRQAASFGQICEFSVPKTRRFDHWGPPTQIRTAFPQVTNSPRWSGGGKTTENSAF